MKPLINRQQIADLLGIHVNTVDRIRREDPTFPHPSALASARTIRWNPDAIERWAESKQERAEARQAEARRLVQKVYS